MADISGLLDASAYTGASELIIRLLGFIYFVAHGAFLFQIKGLLGSRGILPIQEYLPLVKRSLGKKAYFLAPTLFWLRSTDRCLIALPAISLVFSTLLMLNVCPPLCLLLLFIIQISIVSAGQTFLGFGWELFLLEITCNAFFMSLSKVPNPLIWISINLLLFRFYFQGGISKILSRDRTWRTLSALQYHYETQPLPNAIAWHAHKMPVWFHKFSAAMMFFVQLLVPFAIFGPQEIRFIAFLCFFSLQFFIWLTGNFSYLNYMTVVLSTILLSNHYLGHIFSIPQASEPSLPLLTTFLDLSGAALIFLQCVSLKNYFFPTQLTRKILGWVEPFHIANRYGIFAVMTTERYEVVVEGSDDGMHWKEYLFKYKPSEINRRPRWIAPYQPRLDWQVWFLPFSSFNREVWFQKFLGRLLEGSKDVLKLLRYNPFPGKPPKYIRAQLYLYTYGGKKPWYWARALIGSYSPVLILKERS